jgi:hypothetical protein
VNIPVALLILVVTPALMPASTPGRGSVDLVGALTVTAGLAGAVFAIVRAPEVGWGSAQTWLTLAGAVVLLCAFLAIQARRARPLMRLSIFRTPNLGGANIAQLLLGAAWVPMWFFLNLYLQQVLGLEAFASGSALLPMTIMIMFMMVLVAPKAIGRYGPKNMIITGLVVLAVGLLALSFARPTGNFWIDVLPASLVSAVGMGLAFIPSLGMALSSARPEEGGLASGIVNTSYQVGSALGLAAMTAVAAAATGVSGDTGALMDGFSAAFIGAALLAVVGAAFTVALIKMPRVVETPSETTHTVS